MLFTYIEDGEVKECETNVWGMSKTHLQLWKDGETICDSITNPTVKAISYEYIDLPTEARVIHVFDEVLFAKYRKEKKQFTR